MTGTAGGDALTILGTDEKRTFLESGDDGNTGGFCGDVERNSSVGRGHQFVQNSVSRGNAVVELRVSSVRDCDATHAERNEDSSNKIFHRLLECLVDSKSFLVRSSTFWRIGNLQH